VEIIRKIPPQQRVKDKLFFKNQSGYGIMGGLTGDKKIRGERVGSDIRVRAFFDFPCLLSDKRKVPW
jgi:hypothetical protein